MIFYNSIFARQILLDGYSTITLGPLIFTKLKKEEVSQRIINHERIHVAQWGEVMIMCAILALIAIEAFGINIWWLALSPVAYYVWYAAEYVIRRMAGHDKQQDDSRSIAFEREAYANEQDKEYISERRDPFAFIKYY